MAVRLIKGERVAAEGMLCVVQECFRRGWFGAVERVAADVGCSDEELVGAGIDSAVVDSWRAEVAAVDRQEPERFVER